MSIASKFAAGRTSASVLARFALLGASEVHLRAECQQCEFKQEQQMGGHVEFGKSIHEISRFLKQARSHTGATGHAIRTWIIDEREYVLNTQRMNDVRRLQEGRC